VRPSSAFERLLERGRAAHEAERGRVAGGVYRHACRRSWRYAADNYYTRELTGLTTAATAATTATGRSTANSDPPPDGGGLARSLGDVTLADAADAMRVLDASFRVVLVTEVHKKNDGDECFLRRVFSTRRRRVDAKLHNGAIAEPRTEGPAHEW
jgi:hypothetical protein